LGNTDIPDANEPLNINNMKIRDLLYISILLAFIAFPNSMFSQLANSYPNDVGIETNPYVLFVEKFDDGMTNIVSRYSDIQNAAGMSQDSDVPAGSLGPYSIKMTSKQGVNVGGHLFKRFTPGFDNTVYVRYYVKYPSISNGHFHHEAVWFGGYNPATNWPSPQAGTCGLGSNRLSITYENVWPGPQPGMDTYLYWGDMQSWNDGSSCYGNAMITQGRTDYGKPSVPAPTVDVLDQWMCVEIMIKLNNPVTAYNGELAIWQNGVKVGHWGAGFPDGHWLKDKWYNNPTDPPFQGFRWRTDANLKINWLWFEFYHDDPAAPSSYIKFDHMVMATQYIGPISIPTGVNDPIGASFDIRVYPNPVNGWFTISSQITKGEIEIFGVNGEKVFQSLITNPKQEIDLSHLSNGTYLARINDGHTIHARKIIKR
jgi:hypothetical protein